MNTIQALAEDALANVRYIVGAFDPYEAEIRLLHETNILKRLAIIDDRDDVCEAIDRMRIIHQAALAYATGRSYEVPR